MTHLQHFLQPFCSAGRSAELTIECSIARLSGTITMRYILVGRLESILIPQSASAPSRRACLWQGTCMEFFVAPRNRDPYWEFNLSPSGDWNVYRFDTYRRGMQEERSFDRLPSNIQFQQDSLVLGVEIDLGSIIPADYAVTAGISAVIEGRDGSLTYWSLRHPGQEPDFHRRDGFVIEL